MSFVEQSGREAEAPRSRRRTSFTLLRQPILVGATLILLYGLARAVTEVRTYIALAFFAVVMAALLTYPIDFLSRKLPRAAAIALTIVAVVGLVGGLLVLIVPVIATQATNFVHTLPHAVQSVADRLPNGRLGAATRAAAASGLRGVLSYAGPLALDAGHAVAEIVIVFILALFLAASPSGYFRDILTLVPADREPVFTEWWHRTGHALRRWVGGAIVSMTIMGIVAGVGLAIIGVPNWLLLGLLTFLGTLVPYLGAIVSSVPALLIGWQQSPITFVWVLVLYVGVHILEGYLVQPLIMRRAVALRPATLLVWQAIMGGLFGLVGVFIATPALACIKETIKYLYVERRLGKHA